MRWVAGIAVATIAVLLFVLARERVTARTTRATGGDPPAPAPAEAAPAEPANESIVISKALGGTGEPEEIASPENVRVPERRPDPPWDKVTETPEPVVALVELAGTLRVEGDAAPSGTFRLTWISEQGAGGDTIDLRRGAWSAVVPSASKLTFADIRLGGRVAMAVDRELIVPASARVVVNCLWFVPTKLRVLDAGSDTELNAVEVLGFVKSEWRHAFAIHPGPPSAGRTSPVIADAASPITLPEEPGRRIYWVRAAEHAWTHVDLVQGLGGERSVRLPRAGGLDVRLSNFDPDSGAQVRLYDPGGGHLLSWPSKERPRIGALAPGKYRVRVEIGEWSREPFLLGEAAAEVEAGAVTAVAIALRDPPSSERLVALAGALHVDPDWGDEASISMSADSIDVQPGTNDPDVTLSRDGRWSAGRVPPGRYVINVRPWTWWQAVDVGPSGNPDVRIVVPPPCDVEVRVLFADRDEAALVRNLCWGMRLGSTLERVASTAPGRFRFRAPLGEIEFDDTSDDDFEVEARVVDLKPGLNRITLRAARRYGLTIELKDAVTGMNLPVDLGFWARITVAGIDDPECRSTDWWDGTIRVTKPGRYRVMFLEEVDGFRSIDDHEVEVPAEGMARLVIRLKRK